MLTRYDRGANRIWERVIPSVVAGQLDLSVDSTGVYVVGTLPEGGSLAGHTASGSSNGFLVKYSPGGDLLWVRGIGDALGDRLASVVARGDAVYTAGSIGEDWDLGQPGRAVLRIVPFSRPPGACRPLSSWADSSPGYCRGAPYFACSLAS